MLPESRSGCQSRLPNGTQAWLPKPPFFITINYLIYISPSGYLANLSRTKMTTTHLTTGSDLGRWFSGQSKVGQTLTNAPMLRPALHLELSATPQDCLLELRNSWLAAFTHLTQWYARFSHSISFLCKLLLPRSCTKLHFHPRGFSMSIEALQHLEMSRSSYSSSWNTCLFPLTYTNGIPCSVSSLGAEPLCFQNNKKTPSLASETLDR